MTSLTRGAIVSNCGVVRAALAGNLDVHGRLPVAIIAGSGALPYPWRMRRTALCLLVCTSALACAGAADNPTSESTLATAGVESSGSTDSSSGATGDGTPTEAGSATSSSESAADESSGVADASSGEGSSSGGACPAGMLGCPCDMGGCDSDGVCVAGLCEALEMCPADMYEPNDDEAAAVDLGTINDDDDNGGSVAGVLDHEADADWFSYVGDDDVGYVVDPTRDVTADAPVRLCKFAECLEGTTEVNCPPGTDMAMSPGGRPGCCSRVQLRRPHRGQRHLLHPRRPGGGAVRAVHGELSLLIGPLTPRADRRPLRADRR
jgi:hypothetical protein